MVTLVGDGVLLREAGPSDEDAVHAVASDPAVTRFTDWGPNSRAETRAFLAAAAAQRLESPRTTFSLVVEVGGSVIGSAAVWLTDATHRRGEVGVVLGRPYWGRGHAAASVRLLLGHGFGDMGLHRIAATCHPANTGSARMLTSAGLAFEGRLRDHMLVRGAWRDSLLFAAVAE